MERMYLERYILSLCFGDIHLGTKSNPLCPLRGHFPRPRGNRPCFFKGSHSPLLFVQNASNATTSFLYTIIFLFLFN